MHNKQPTPLESWVPEGWGTEYTKCVVVIMYTRWHTVSCKDSQRTCMGIYLDSSYVL